MAIRESGGKSTAISAVNTTAITVNYGASAVSGQVRVRSTNACGSSAYFVKAVTVNSCLSMASSAETGALTLEAYPNPASERIMITLGSAMEARYVLTLTDLSGRIVYQESLNAAEGLNDHSIDLNQIAPGAYLLQAVSDSESAQIRIIVE